MGSCFATPNSSGKQSTVRSSQTLLNMWPLVVTCLGAFSSRGWNWMAQVAWLVGTSWGLQKWAREEGLFFNLAGSIFGPQFYWKTYCRVPANKPGKIQKRTLLMGPFLGPQNLSESQATCPIQIQPNEEKASRHVTNSGHMLKDVREPLTVDRPPTV